MSAHWDFHCTCLGVFVTIFLYIPPFLPGRYTGKYLGMCGWRVNHMHKTTCPFIAHMFVCALPSTGTIPLQSTGSCRRRHLLLPAATKLGQGNVFTGVCDSVHRRGGLPQCMLGYPPGPDPPTRHPPTRHPPDQTLPGVYPPREQTPLTRHPPDQTPTTPPGKQTPAYGQ